ncbi:MAG: hypothetical protein ACQEST_10375, partial [Bacteroidota bacterium]
MRKKLPCNPLVKFLLASLPVGVGTEMVGSWYGDGIGTSGFSFCFFKGLKMKKSSFDLANFCR